MTATPRFSIILVGGDDRAGAAATRESIDRQRYLDRELIECNPNGDPASERTSAIERARGEFLAFVDAGDVLHPDALARVAEVAGDSIDLVYTDEDTLDRGSHRDPFFKPDWSPDRLRAQHYTGRLAAYRRNLVIEVGGVRAEMLDAYEHDLVLRLAERALESCTRAVPALPPCAWLAFVPRGERSRPACDRSASRSNRRAAFRRARCRTETRTVSVRRCANDRSSAS